MTTPTLTREDLHADIESRVRRAFSEREERSASYGPEFASLWRSAADQVLGGKLLRPRLLVQMHDALMPSDTPVQRHREAVVEIAAAIEILHYAFLLHDDVIDGDARRRGKPNLIGMLRDERAELGSRTALHWGSTGAILMGDLLLSLVHQMFARVDVTQAERLRLLDLLDHAITETVAGEYADVALSDRVITPELQTILTMTARKTATYTFELPLRVATVLSLGDVETEDALAQIGQRLGLAFQLQDDVLSVFGDPSEHGKDAYSDLREGKETVLIAYARMTSSWSRIQPHFGDAELSTGRAAEVARHLRGCGAEDYVLQLVDEQLEHVRSSIRNVSPALPEGARATLETLISRIEGRRA